MPEQVRSRQFSESGQIHSAGAIGAADILPRKFHNKYLLLFINCGILY